ncbi:MAG: hypothetical protein BTN85_1438 [Candidatus Methanohalarchaeum thermophilum]|uniref:Uncharacterized protein n=1 Tax=Methanohalarchaeum thermophilum TaxID=1903181 RepID=A0A1Q6DX51_METT1|nr:MAG: hypothetical protein BTN85_1438 [Candidatus Methanohalarchaeum thermophilum]
MPEDEKKQPPLMSHNNPIEDIDKNNKKLNKSMRSQYKENENKENKENQ